MIRIVITLCAGDETDSSQDFLDITCRPDAQAFKKRNIDGITCAKSGEAGRDLRENVMKVRGCRVTGA
jgi:hypothetical protein